jgi:hypothetical protein
MLQEHPPSLMPFNMFLKRFVRNLFFGFILIVLSLLLGMIGYHHFENMSWIDSYVNAAMILSGMGPVSTLQTDAGKIFAGSYALFSGIGLLVIIAIIFAPVVKRFMHKFHLEDTKK